MEKRLSELEPKERGVITRVEGSGALRRRLLDMGLKAGRFEDQAQWALRGNLKKQVSEKEKKLLQRRIGW